MYHMSKLGATEIFYQEFYVIRLCVKGAWSDCFRFFSNYQRFWYQKKAHIFLITPDEFYSGKMYHLDDINENVTSNGNHNNKLTQYWYRQLQNT